MAVSREKKAMELIEYWLVHSICSPSLPDQSNIFLLRSLSLPVRLVRRPPMIIYFESRQFPASKPHLSLSSHS